MGRALAVAPSGERSGRHFVEDEGGGEALSAGVPARAEGKEGLHVVRGAGAGVIEGQVGKREIEKLEVELFGVFADADVVRLEIAVGDAFVLEVFEDVEQVVAEALEEFAGEAAIFAEAVGEGALAGELHEERIEAVESEDFLGVDGSDDKRGTELVEGIEQRAKALGEWK